MLSFERELCALNYLLCKLAVKIVFQNSMNLPPDKVRLLRSYDNDKKWELICDQVGGVNKVHEFECVPTTFL